MGIAGNTLDMIRTVFNRDGQLPKGPSYFDTINSNAISYSNVTLGPQNGYNDYLTDSVKIDQDLMSRYADYEDMSEFSELGCVVGSTKVLTVDYGYVEIQELAKIYPNGQKFKIFAYDRKDRKFVVAEAHSPRITKKTKMLVEILTDKGSRIRCTPDHKFLTRDSVYMDAEKLIPGQSLMPWHTSKTNKGYVRIYNPERHYTDPFYRDNLHRLVAEYKFGDLGDLVVHHKDGDKSNNSFHNMELMTRADHLEEHRGEYKPNQKAGWSEKRRLLKTESLRGSQLKWHKQEVDRLVGAREYKPRTNKNLTYELVLSTLQRSVSVSEAARQLSCDWTTLTRRCFRWGIDYRKVVATKVVNHKVKQIRWINEETDVYDLTTDIYHNFVAEGVVIHNSALDLFADDATVQDTLTGKSMWFESNDETIENVLNEMLDINLKAEQHLWEICRSLCTYGNEFEELMVVDGVGVVKLNHLPPPTARRIEDLNGILYGFIQDPAMHFRMDTKTFLERLQEKAPAELSPIPDNSGVGDLMQVYEPWEVVHFRLRGHSRSDLYGHSVLEAARWAWKRLTMIEDAMVLYKLCLRGDSRIWTTDGYKFIKDLKEGDEVYCFDDRQVKRTKVSYWKHNGKDRIYKVQSKNHTLHANSTHPVLVEFEDKELNSVMFYVEVQNLQVGKHRFVVPSLEGYTTETISSVTLDNVDNIYDIGVESKAHNFIAEGVVVHNTRSPQRYAYYVDVGDVPPNQAKGYLNRIKNEFKKEKFIDKDGKLSFRFNPLSQDEDLFLPVRKGKRSTEVEVLSGPEGQQIDDAEYFLNKIFAALKIPKSYLGADETVGRANLSQLDSRFCRTVMRVQREMKNGYTQIARVDLAARNIDPDRVDYECHMVVPSGVFELAQMEVQQAKLDLADRYKGLEFSEYYIWSEIMGMSDEEIRKVQSQRAREGSSDLDTEESQKVREIMPKQIDRESDRLSKNKKLKDVTPKILAEIQKEQSKFAKRMKEVRLLTQEIRQVVKSQKYYRGRDSKL